MTHEMSSLHLVDPELLPMLQEPALQWNATTLPVVREYMRHVGDMRRAGDELVEVTAGTVPGAGGAPAVDVIVYRPAGAVAALPAYLYIHGGGLVGGTPFLADVENRYLARTLQCVVVAPAYRVAPEYPYPAASDDCYSVLRYLQSEGQTLGIDPSRIAIGGDSAGGGLTAALALRNRDSGGPRPVLQILVYPMLDDRTGTVEAAHLAGEFLWDADCNRFGWSSYLGDIDHERVPPWASPARATQFSDLPSAYLTVGQLDLFVDETLDYARHLIHAGVRTELHVLPGAIHSFDNIPHAKSSELLRSTRATALRRAFTDSAFP